MKVSNFSVLLNRKNELIDITDTIININITESIFGNIEGNVEVVDGAGILDAVVGNQNTLVVEFLYLDKHISHEFYIDGVNHIDMTTSLVKKTYMINLKSINDLLDSMQLISKSFKGRSSDIIRTIFDESFGTKLNVLDESLTNGHYIAPNISPKKAIKQIKQQMYNRNNNPFFIFERLNDNRHTILTSLSQIEDQIESVNITQQIQNSESVDAVLSNVAQPSKIVIHSDNDNMIYKTSKGVYGKTILNLDISNSKVNNETYGATHGSNSIINLLRNDMFDDGTPLLNNSDHGNICNMQSILNMLFNTRVTAYDCHAAPNIGVGNKATLEIPVQSQSMVPSSKFSGSYVISAITHNIKDNEYTQNIELMRG